MGTSAKALSVGVTNQTGCTFKIRIAWLNTMSVTQTTLFTVDPFSTNNFTLPANAVTVQQGRLYTTGGTALSVWFPLPGYHLCYEVSTASCPSCSLGMRIDLEPTGNTIRCGPCE